MFDGIYESAYRAHCDNRAQLSDSALAHLAALLASERVQTPAVTSGYVEVLV